MRYKDVEIWLQHHLHLLRMQYTHNGSWVTAWKSFPKGGVKAGDFLFFLLYPTLWCADPESVGNFCSQAISPLYPMNHIGGAKCKAWHDAKSFLSYNIATLGHIFEDLLRDII